MAEPLSEDWVATLVDASAHRQGGTGVVAITMGKTKQAVLDIVDGKVVGPGAAEEAAVTIPVTASQLAAIVEGEESLAEAFMRGDVKPVGATGPLLVAVELFEDEAVRQRLVAATGD